MRKVSLFKRFRPVKVRMGVYRAALFLDKPHKVFLELCPVSHTCTSLLGRHPEIAAILKPFNN
jgi:hypothetical protein